MWNDDKEVRKVMMTKKMENLKKCFEKICISYLHGILRTVISKSLKMETKKPRVADRIVDS
jgi:hypothetical protein